MFQIEDLPWVSNFGIFSHGFAFFAFLALTIMLAVSRQKNERNGSLLVASLLSTLWALLATVQSHKPVLFWAFGGLLDTMRILAWAYFLSRILKDGGSTQAQDPDCTRSQNQSDGIRENRKLKGLEFPILLSAFAFAHLGLWWISAEGALTPQNTVRLIASLWILACILALFCLERFIRATPKEKRSKIGYMSIGLGAMFLFDFIIFTDAQLFSRINTDLWFARGFAYALLVPLIALSIARNPQWSVTLHVSRQAVTSSITAVVCGAYLLITALAAYFVRFSGAEWASVAEVVVILTALVMLALLVFSTNLRSRIRVFVSKHLFNFKYDYRHEWLNFTDTLASQIGDTPNAVLQGLTQLVNSDGGTVWRTAERGRVEIIAARGKLANFTINDADAASIEQFVLQSQWLINLDDFNKQPSQYEGLSLSPQLLDNHDIWLILPLFFREELLACLLFERSAVRKDINWEDRDLLKTAGRQAATLLKQADTQSKLAEASQFQAFSKLSAYIVHDLKNVIGQQSLLVSNAARHKRNPEFVDDVITTVDNSVKRMQALLEQLRANSADGNVTRINLVKTLEQVVSNRAKDKPVPTLKSSSNNLTVNADPTRLLRVFGHLVQNAQEATTPDGEVTMEVSAESATATVFIRDTGSGMTSDFIQNKLFKAFESTKGLTGMGIGVFESQEYIQSLGGDMSVTSELGVGSVFRVRIPLVVYDARY